jgi:hypothetical protein
MNEVKTYSLYELQGYTSVYGKTEFVAKDHYTALQEQLTATTNSLTNAQEALKSAGIEADTVQAGVMELVSRMNQVVAENVALKEYLKECSIVQGEGNWTSDAEKSVYVPAEDWMPTTPATEACLNAVRAEVLENVPTVCDGKEQLAFEAYASSKGLDLSKHPLHYLFLDGKTNQARSAWRECLVYVAAQLRAGNAGKDGV